jgi:predicted transglutaminase-like cysteine proteinase
MFAIQPSIIGKAGFAVVALWSAFSGRAETEIEAGPPEGQLTLPVVKVVGQLPPYADFCRRQPDECDLSGDTVIDHSPDLMRKLDEVNISVNHQIRFALDASQYGLEEYWALPVSGYGDCEDLALEKRSRLAASGVPRGALRLAIVFHRKHLNSHCVLTVDTSRGTYVLDSYTHEVRRWDRTSYNYEARERTDGLWDRFDQTNWRYEH